MGQTIHLFRECGECTACCDGHLSGEVYGEPFGNHKPCSFLQEKTCQIYQERPTMCRRYQCAYTQFLLPRNMRPDISQLLVSVEFDQEGKQYLKAVEMSDTVPYESYAELNRQTANLNTYNVIIPFRR
jgi:Fe-S-cluster containining protein